MKKTVPITTTTPTSKSIQRTSANSIITKESVSGTNQSWPNKQKRIYQVIPSLTGDSRKTSRQSSFGPQPEQIKVTEILSAQSRPKSSEKSNFFLVKLCHCFLFLSLGILSPKPQLRGQYHYGPEAEEIEILKNDPENAEHKSTIGDMEETNFYETLSADQFLRESSAQPHSRAVINVPEFGGNSQLDSHETAEDLIQHDEIDTNNARARTAKSTYELTPAKELTIHDTESLIQTAPERRIESGRKSQNIIINHESPPNSNIAFEIDNNAILSKPIENSRPSTKASRTTPIAANDDLIEKVSTLHLPTIDSTTAGVIASPSPRPPLPPPTDNNVAGVVAYFFSDFSNENESDDDTIPIDQNNFTVPPNADVISDDIISNNLLTQSQASLLILHSSHVPQQQQQEPRQPTSAMSSTIKNNIEHRKVEENEEIESREIDETKKPIITTTSVLPSSSPSPKEILPTPMIDDMQTQFSRKNSTSNDDHHRQSSTTVSNFDAVYSNIEEQEKQQINSRIRRGSSSLSKSQMNSRIHSATSQQQHETLKNDDEEIRSASARSHTPFKNIDNEYIDTTERINSANRRLKSTSRTLSRGQSINSARMDNGEVITPIDSATKSPLSHIQREDSVDSRAMSDPPTIAPSEQSRLSQRKSGSLSRSATNDDLRQSNMSNDQVEEKPTVDNEPNAFTVQSEHFLHRGHQMSFDMNQRVPSNFSPSHQDDSRQGSIISNLPVALDSPENQINPQKTSRTTTPKDKMSICSIEAPDNPNVILTTTDDPDPNDPSVTNSTIHFQMLSSQPINTTEYPLEEREERDEPSPLENIVPIQEFPLDIQSVELPSESLPPEEQQLHKSPSSVRRSPVDESELPPNNQLPSISPERHSPVPTSPIHRTPSPPKVEQQEVSPHQSPVLSYPARLEDLMRPTPSPFLSTNDHEKDLNNQEQDENNQLLTVATLTNETKLDENPFSKPTSPAKSENNNIQSQLSSPRRSVLSSTNHTSVEGDDTDRQPLDTPPISPKQSRVISPDHYHIIHNKQPESPKQKSTSPPVIHTFPTEKQHYSSSEKSNSPTQPQQEHHFDEHLYRNDIQLSSASIKLAKHPTPHSYPSEMRPPSTDDDYPSMTPSQQQSKLSLRVRKKKHSRKQSLSDEQLSPTPPQIDVGMPRERLKIMHNIYN